MFSCQLKRAKFLILDYLYYRLMWCRFYRLANTTDTRTATSVTCILPILKTLKFSINYFKITGKDPILIYDFLSRLFEVSDVLDVD